MNKSEKLSKHLFAQSKSGFLTKKYKIASNVIKNFIPCTEENIIADTVVRSFAMGNI